MKWMNRFPALVLTAAALAVAGCGSDEDTSRKENDTPREAGVFFLDRMADNRCRFGFLEAGEKYRPDEVFRETMEHKGWDMYMYNVSKDGKPFFVVPGGSEFDLAIVSDATVALRASRLVSLLRALGDVVDCLQAQSGSLDDTVSESRVSVASKGEKSADSGISTAQFSFNAFMFQKSTAFDWAVGEDGDVTYADMGKYEEVNVLKYRGKPVLATAMLDLLEGDDVEVIRAYGWDRLFADKFFDEKLPPLETLKWVEDDCVAQLTGWNAEFFREIPSAERMIEMLRDNGLKVVIWQESVASDAVTPRMVRELGEVGEFLHFAGALNYFEKQIAPRKTGEVSHFAGYVVFPEDPELLRMMQEGKKRKKRK